MKVVPRLVSPRYSVHGGTYLVAEEEVTAKQKLTETFLTLQQGRRIVDMLDGLVSALGPDIDMLLGYLSEVSTKYIDHGVKPEFFQQLGQAAREVLRGMLGNKWTNSTEEAWTRVFDDISEEMARTAVKELAVKRAASALPVSAAQ